MQALRLLNVSKEYPEFSLCDVSFNVGKGRVVGLIGRNGAGKTTLLKSILKLIPYEGKIDFFEQGGLEQGSKQRVGYVAGGFDFYKMKTLKAVASCTLGFYGNRDDKTYRELMKKFGLSETKKINELSEGMKVKFALTLALSHGAELLIMDEPTSGLDPVSREELCDIILDLVKTKGVSVLFSTHITEDLMRIADDIAYLSDGKLLLFEELQTLLNKYEVAVFPSEDTVNAADVIGLKQVKNGYEGLILKDTAIDGIKTEPATVDKIMLHFDRARRNND